MEGCCALAIGTCVLRGPKLALWNVGSPLKAVETPICAYRPEPTVGPRTVSGGNTPVICRSIQKRFELPKAIIIISTLARFALLRPDR